MKKRNLKTIKLNKRIVSTLNTVIGGLARNDDDIRPGTEISYCHVGSRVQCCA
ncbi:hypothetical protein [Kordia sp.]|uniref:hypothetical protein n=1 Tax=Kordia sp. TaxID=1965332 RepID=UPI003D2BF969